MASYFRAASTLSAAIGFAMSLQALPASGEEMASKDASNLPQVVKDNMARAMAKKLDKCYGINAVAKDDCSEGVHSCAGQATIARDTKSFVLVPAGDCEKIDGGKPKAS
jgi:uncharacterized membrane protein